MNIVLRLLLLVLIAVSFAVTTDVHAQEGAGISLVPAFIEEGADPGSVFEQALRVSNESDEEKEFYIFKKNIKDVEAGGVPIFAEDEAEVTGYEISEWVSLQEERILLPPRGEKELRFTITVPDNATPGSHFGGIFVSAEPPKYRKIGAGVGYEVASILSIRISGDINDDARVRSFSTNKLLFNSKDVDFSASIENKGNILIRPHGIIEIRSMFSSDPVILNFNTDLAGVFPGKIRDDFLVSWDDGGLGFGKYEATLALTYDGENGQKTIDAGTVFWIFPAKIMITALGVLIFILLGGYFLTRYYINQAIMRAGGARRIPPQRYRKQVGVSRFTFVFMSVMAILVIFLIIILISIA